MPKPLQSTSNSSSPSAEAVLTRGRRFFEEVLPEERYLGGAGLVPPDQLAAVRVVRVVSVVPCRRWRLAAEGVLREAEAFRCLLRSPGERRFSFLVL